MNDYKELIEMLRSMSRAIIREDANDMNIPEENIWDADANALADAADAIEPLVKERDAAVDDIPHNCTYCKHRKDHDWCERGHRWEWRGAREDNDEAD